MKTKNEIAAGMYVVLVACKHAKDKGGIGGVPNGHLYAQLMEHFTIDEWTPLIAGMLVGGESGPVITQENYLLKITEHGEKLWAEMEEIYSSAKK